MNLVTLAGLLLLSVAGRCRGRIVINELMYHHPAGEMFDYVELFNTDEHVAVDVSGWQLRIGAATI